MADTTWSSGRKSSTRAVGLVQTQNCGCGAVAAGKRFSFGLGIASTFVALVTLAALLIDLFIAGYPRLTWDFFTNFPSRRATQAGILSAWVGSLLVILTTAVIGVFLGVSAGIYLEEYAPPELDHEHHRDQHQQSRGRSLDRLRPAGARDCSSTRSAQGETSSRRA